jgi:selenocysteine-specific elongation factor
MHVIGTAGHVDHGKSSLIAALTGTHPDRLKEEQEREMTIDLGFAWLTLPGGEEVGIVDVPGHRDFIGNMLAGVGGIDAALLVIAADEGLMPQTREHLAILDLLQIPAGVVALNKVDLVADPEWLDLVEAEIQAALRGTVLEGAPIQRVSARTGAGLPELVQVLADRLRERPARPDLGRPRLPIDRVFSMPGFGTVVTGTLSDGRLSAGDEVELLPSGVQARIRGLQTHRRKEDVAVPGSRTAVNLSGLEAGQVRRGEVLVRPGQYKPSQRLDVRIRALPDLSAPIRHHTEVKLFLGTAEVVADLRLLGAETLAPGGSGWLQLELHEPVVAVHGDRFILRRPSPGETLGGGTVVDPHPAGRHKRFDAQLLAALESMAQGSPGDLLLQASLALGPAPLKNVVARARLETSAAQAALDELTAAGELLLLEEVLVAAVQFQEIRTRCLAELGEYHRAYPLRAGMPREELKSRLKLPPRVFNLVVQHLAQGGELSEGPKWLALPGHRVLFSPFEQVKVDRLLAQFAASPAAPPSVKDCQEQVGEEVYAALLDSGSLIAVSAEVVFRAEDHQAMVAKIRQALGEKGQITLAEVRDLLGTSRKYVQALLEHLDASGVTVRDGDFRRLKGA